MAKFRSIAGVCGDALRSELQGLFDSLTLIQEAVSAATASRKMVGRCSGIDQTPCRKIS